MAEEAPPPYASPELYGLTGGPLGRPPGDERRTETAPTVAGHPVEALVERFGSPLYVLDEAALRGAYRRLIGAFREGWENTFIGASVKTNYLSAVIAILRAEGAYGEVVSGFEYRLCRDLGIPGDQILFNGPWKTDDDLRQAFAEGVTVNLDGDDELARVERIAAEIGREVTVGLRINMQVNYPPWDKFGFKLEDGHALDAARLIDKSEHLRLNGLHLHVGTYIPDPGLYGRGMEALIGLATRIERETDARIEQLDIGGGYATRNTLHDTMLPGEAICATPEEYAAAITGPLQRAVGQLSCKPRLFIEPGRILVDEAASMITTVRAVKRMAGAQKAALVDCGVHIMPTAWWYDHEIRPVVDRGAPVEDYRIVGPLCMQIDVLRKSVVLPALREGDLLVIQDVGAYNFSQSMQFIYMRPNYVMAHEGGVDLIRERETDEYVRGPERLPARLENEETAGSFLWGRGERD
ncbi:MAG: alanine racemase [Planctomycetota bacterium]|jgi:diaminopimelate decarboxylase|nr:alanine racemase [Planctomycetota bacterium]